MSCKSERYCGQCNNFDPMRVDKTPFGNIKLETGEELKKGVCRTGNGLGFGVVHEMTSCKQKPSERFFISRELSA